ncbi:hypothetical protein MMC10_004043 [Thelotrema lepadinum]|nr:hypothetical protein [Thelotrema lepadinum]
MDIVQHIYHSAIQRIVSQLSDMIFTLITNLPTLSIVSNGTTLLVDILAAIMIPSAIIFLVIFLSIVLSFFADISLCFTHYLLPALQVTDHFYYRNKVLDIIHWGIFLIWLSLQKVFVTQHQIPEEFVHGGGLILGGEEVVGGMKVAVREPRQSARLAQNRM